MQITVKLFANLRENREKIEKKYTGKRGSGKKEKEEKKE